MQINNATPEAAAVPNIVDDISSLVTQVPSLGPPLLELAKCLVAIVTEAGSVADAEGAIVEATD